MPLGQVDPAMQPQPKPGQEARGQVVAGLGLEMVRTAITMFPKESPMAIALAETAAKLGKLFKKPEQDLGQAELKFMGQQLYPGQRPAAMDMGGDIRQTMQGMGAGAPGGPGGAPQMAGMGAAGPQGG